MKSAADSSEKALRAGWWILSALAIALVIFIRIRFLDLPLERDEGEYAYTGQLMLQGIPPYQLACNMKFPGTAAAYALSMSIFGQTTAGVHLGLLLVNAATITLIFVLGRRLVDTTAGLAAAAAYAVLSIMPHLLGTAAHATHFVILPVLGGVMLLLRDKDRPSYPALFSSGLLFGIALLMKQPALFFTLFAVVCLFFWNDWSLRNNIFQRTAIFMAGVIVPVAVTLLVLWWSGVFGKFWFWTIDYARQYGSQISLPDGARMFVGQLPDVIGTAWPLWTMAALGLVTFPSRRPVIGFLALFLLFALLATTPGFYFRPHYFIVLLPALSLLAGAAVTGAARSVRSPGLRFVPLVLFGIALGFPVLMERDLFFQRSLFEASRMLYGTNPFPEAVKIADFLHANTTEKDTVAVIGSEPEIYFYARRRSATSYVYTYSLMEPQKYARQMQDEMIREIEQARPKFLVLVAVDKSWRPGPNSDKSIFTWANKYCNDDYEAVGLVNIHAQESDFYFSEIPKAPALAPDYIWIYRRKV